MSRLSAQSIRRHCQFSPTLITPFHERSVHKSGLSYGLSGCSYDVRVAEHLQLMPGELVLASTLEQFDIPFNLSMDVKDKSTWARRGVFVQNTFADPGFRGHITLEITNDSNHVWWIEAGTPIAQMVFELLDEETEQPYKGKYQNQEAGPQLARLEV